MLSIALVMVVVAVVDKWTTAKDSSGIDEFGTDGDVVEFFKD